MATSGTVADTLSMLEERLSRIDYVINGDNNESKNSEPTTNASAATRLRNLERTLKALTAKSHAVSDVLQIQKQYPELFHSADEKTAPTTLHPASLAQLILAHENLYKTTSSQLATLHDNSNIPDSAPLVRLISSEPRIERVEAKQIEQAREFAELRLRSTRLLEKWYTMGILDMGEKWADWEERLRDCEILVRRKEAAKKREEGTL
ncbi:Putative dynactin subunit 3 [Septoria linicola]|uniref:Dynactin subunit 3 n=1 Tax=Septoria linicola TaxID=215465 RepID=A0A9Q9ATY7_9PEZI|nr:putative dynactin subunit 3 [Septoria linicola]USW52093.1 Putative dynactin subunit 3 [Septoria linicola]